MENAKAESEFCNGMLCFRLSGEIDHHSAAALREQMDRDIYFFRPRLAVLSFGQVDFMDSSGLGLILGRYTRLRDLQGSMKIEDPTPQIEKILRMAGVDLLIPIVRTKKPAGAKRAQPQRARAGGKEEKGVEAIGAAEAEGQESPEGKEER